MFPGATISEHAAKMVFDFWEREAAAIRRRRGEDDTPIAWSDLAPEWREKWTSVIGMVVDMATEVAMTDAYVTLAREDHDFASLRARAISSYAQKELGIDVRALSGET